MVATRGPMLFVRSKLFGEHLVRHALAKPSRMQYTSVLSLHRSCVILNVVFKQMVERFGVTVDAATALVARVIC